MTTPSSSNIDIFRFSVSTLCEQISAELSQVNVCIGIISAMEALSLRRSLPSPAASSFL